MEKPYNVLITEHSEISDMLDNFASSIYDALRHLGCNVAYMRRDIWDKLWTSRDRMPEHGLVAKCDFIVSFNNIDINLDIYETLGIPLLSVCVDRPFHLKTGFDSAVKNVVCCWSDENDLKYAPSYFKSAGHKFLPHAGEVIPNPWLFLMNDRRTDVVVSCNNVEKERPWFLQVRGAYGKEVFESVTDRYSEGGMRLEDCVREVLRCGDEELFDFMRTDGLAIDTSVRLEKKHKVLKILVDAGIKVECFGANWEDSDLNDTPLFIRRGYALSKDVHSALEHTKILVNALPVFNASAHERIFNAMQRGALCVTDPTDWLRQHFEDGESIVFYDINDPADLTRKVSFYLENEEERMRITRNAMGIVQKGHTWINRAGELLEIYEGLTR